MASMTLGVWFCTHNEIGIPLAVVQRIAIIEFGHESSH
jgi:hypothetical protein